MNLFNYLHNFYIDKLNFTEEEFELLCNISILNLCAEGLSNNSIVRRTNIVGDSVVETIKKYFYFDGWEKDLDLNPLKVYNSSEDLDEYVYNISMVSPLMELDIIMQSYYICKLYIELDNRLEKKYNDD